MVINNKASAKMYYPSISGQILLSPKLHTTEKLMMSKACRPETPDKNTDLTDLNMAKLRNLKCLEIKETTIICSLVMVWFKAEMAFCLNWHGGKRTLLLMDATLNTSTNVCSTRLLVQSSERVHKINSFFFPQTFSSNL